MRMKTPTSSRQKHSGADWSCRVCGEAVKVRSDTVWVWVVEGGYSIATPDEEEPDTSNCGCHPVGPRCARLIPAEYRIRMLDAA